MAPLVMRTLSAGRPVVLELDGTDWKPAKRYINSLVLVLVTRRFRVSLSWANASLYQSAKFLTLDHGVSMGRVS